MGRPLEFAPDEVWGAWTALGAVDLEQAPGKVALDLGPGGTFPVSIAPHAYRTSRLRVPPAFISPPEEVAERIAAERKVKQEVFAAQSPRFWRGRFVPPSATAQTAAFGSRRTYNGKTRGIHQGLDFRAAVGTAIRASNHGRVALARPMYYEGGLVVIDHGQSLFTLYMHLSKFLVREGERVEAGQPIAESGSSGRVTGPHLHFGVRWQGLYMEPATLLALAPR